MKIKTYALLSFAIIIGLSACSNSTTTKPQESSEDPPSNSTAADASNPYKNKLDLNFFVNGPADSVLPKGDKDFVKMAIDKKFNVNLTLTFMPIGTDYYNKLNLLIASGDTPDLMESGGIQTLKYIADHVTADMTPYVNLESMPNYFKWLSEVELKRYQVLNTFQRAPVVFPREVYRSYYIRQDWLDQLKLPVPQTYEDMMKVMHAFTYSDPDNNGRQDTYGFSANGNGTSPSLNFPQYIKNGLIGGSMVVDNKYVDVQSDARIGDVLQDIKEMLNDGVVDPDWFLNKGTQDVDKAVQGKVGIITGTTRTFALDSDPTSIQNKSKALNPKADWVPFSPFGETGNWSENLPANAFLFSKKNEEQAEKIARITDILDWLTSQEGFLLTHFGQEGKEYTLSGDEITPDAEAYNSNIVMQGNFLLPYAFMTDGVYDPKVLGLKVNDPNLTDRDHGILATIASYKLIPSIGTNVAPPDGFNLADFRKKMNEYESKILLDEKDASNWPKYRDDLMKNYGGEAMVKAYEDQIRAAGIIK